MHVLIKLFYYLRTLPIRIPQKFFSQLTAYLGKFIWAGKKPRIALTNLYKPKCLGGVGLPNAQEYYKVAILDQAKHWFSCKTDNRWTQLERENTPGHNLPALAMAASLHHGPTIPSYLTIQATTATWSSMTRQKLPLASYEYLIPGLSTQSWAKKGVHFSTADITDPDALDRYKIYQIQHYKTSNKAHPIELPPSIWNYLRNKNISKLKGISLFYKAASLLCKQIKLPNMVKWERDLQKEFTLHQWQLAIHYKQ